MAEESEIREKEYRRHVTVTVENEVHFPSFIFTVSLIILFHTSSIACIVVLVLKLSYTQPVGQPIFPSAVLPSQLKASSTSCTPLWELTIKTSSVKWRALPSKE
jgi:hypothetical protein